LNADVNCEQDGPDGEYTVYFNSYADGGKVGKPESIKVDVVIGADGANSRVAKEIDAGEYDYAIAFQVSLTISGFFMASSLGLHFQLACKEPS
jgi:geranylgeranyl reductase